MLSNFGMGSIKLVLSSLLFLIAKIPNAFACDPCVLSNLVDTGHRHQDDVILSLKDQYVNFRKGETSSFYSLKNGEILKSLNITQLNAYYGFQDGWGLGFNSPYLIREVDNVENYKRTSGVDSGIGDISLFLSFSKEVISNNQLKLSAAFFSGVKLPTGDTGEIEDFSQNEPAQNPLDKHHGVSGLALASGGRIFSFGTGSIDFPFGIQSQFIYSKFYLPFFAQFNLKTEGAHEYQFANDFTFSVSPGFFLFLEDSFIISSHFTFLGEFKGSDKFRGGQVEQTSYSNLYGGPSLIFNFDAVWSFETSALFRLTEEDNSLIVPDTRFSLEILRKF